MIELIQTDLENEVVDKVTYRYQDDKLVEEKEHFASGGYYILNYAYDDQGHLLSASKSDDAGNSQGRAEFTYNNNYKESIEKQYDENGSLIHEVEKHINDKDKIILEHDRNPALMEEKSVYHYDDKDLLEKVEVFTDGELIILETFTYDENGKEIKMLSQDFEDESETITTQKRDEKGRSILAEKHIDGVLEQYEKRTYDEADETTQLEVWFRVGRFNDEQLDQARYEIEYYS